MSDATAVRGSHAPAGVAPAREALLRWVDEAGEAGRPFLEAHLLRIDGGRYRIRHQADRGLAVNDLERVSDPFAAREIAQVTAAGEHRPLKTAPNMRRGWTLEPLDGPGLWIALDYLYPACGVHWHAERDGSLRVTHWSETAARQSGIYSAVRLLKEDAVRDTVRACCGDAVCRRRVAWGLSPEEPAPLPTELREGAGPEEGISVPCPEACSMFISFARKVLTLERANRQEVPGLGTLAGAEVEQIREIVAAAADGTIGAAREGEFSLPTNSRRVRYLAARLSASAVPAEAEDLPCDGCPRAVPCAGCPLVGAA